MTESRKLAAILAADVLTGDEDRTLARLRALQSDLLEHDLCPQGSYRQTHRRRRTRRIPQRGRRGAQRVTG